MSNKKFYCWCELQKKVNDGTKIDMAWIPERFAQINKIVKIKKDGGWDEGWEVTYVGPRQLASIVENQERDYLKQRKVSDI